MKGSEKHACVEGVITNTSSRKSLGHLSINDVTFACAGLQQQQEQVPVPAPFRGPKEYCYYETFDARCSEDEVILMTSALYGRMRFGRCVKTNFGFMGCFTDVLDLLDRQCSGRRSCSVEVVEPTFDGVRPCNKELKCYLEVDYRCIRSTSPVYYHDQPCSP